MPSAGSASTRPAMISRIAGANAAIADGYFAMPLEVRMRFGRFTVYTVLGCLPWVIALTWIGALLGERWDRAEAIIRPFAWVIAGVLLVGLVWFVWNRIRQIRREEAARGSRPPSDVPGRAVASPRAPDAGVSPLEGTIPTGTAERVDET